MRRPLLRAWATALLLVACCARFCAPCAASGSPAASKVSPHAAPAPGGRAPPGAAAPPAKVPALAGAGGRGPGLYAVPLELLLDDDDGGGAPGGGGGRGPALSLMSTDAPARKAAAAQTAAPLRSRAECPGQGKLLSAAATPSDDVAPVAWAPDGTALVWGSAAAPPRDTRGSVGSVLPLDRAGGCDFPAANAVKLPTPASLLPARGRRFAFGELAKGAAAPTPLLSHVAASQGGQVVVVAASEPAAPAGGGDAGAGASNGSSTLLAVFSYQKTSKPGARLSYAAAGALPVPAPAGLAPAGVRISGLSLAQDGATALVCLMPRCGAGAGQPAGAPRPARNATNPSACGSGWAHVFRLSSGAGTARHSWRLASTLPFGGYGDPVGHGVACSLSLDGATAAVLAASSVRELVSVPVTSDRTDLPPSRLSAGIFDGRVDAGGARRRQRRRRLASQQQQQAGGPADAGGGDAEFVQVTTASRAAYLQLYSAAGREGPWKAVGTQPLPGELGQCITGRDACRPLVDVTSRFAAVSYVAGPELKVEVVFHDAPRAAADGRFVEFVKVCTLSKLLAVQIDHASGSGGGQHAGDIDVPGPSAEQLAMLSIRQRALSLRVLAATRDPGAVFLWTLSRRGEQACPSAPKNLAQDFNPTYAALPLLSASATGDGLQVLLSGLLDGGAQGRLAAVGTGPSK